MIEPGGIFRWLQRHPECRLGAQIEDSVEWATCVVYALNDDRSPDYARPIERYRAKIPAGDRFKLSEDYYYKLVCNVADRKNLE